MTDSGPSNQPAATDPHRVLVTGGAGFLGINLVRFLLKKGHTITSLDIAEFDYPERDAITCVLGDIRDKATVDQLMAETDVVVNCAAALPRFGREEIFSTDVEGFHIVLESALEHGVGRLIQISSTAVYGVPDHHPLVETDSLHGVGPYGEAKVAAEKLCEEYRELGLYISVIRPKSFVGPERLGVFSLLYDWATDGRNFPMLGSGRNRYQLLDVEDLCDAIHRCATQPGDQANDVFNIGAEVFTTMREDYQVVLEEAGHGKRIVGLPAKPAIWTLRVLDRLGLSPLYSWVYETATKDSFVSIERARCALGWKPAYSNKDALLRNYKWYLDNLSSFEGQSGVSHRVPWKQGVLGLAKWFF